jgi:sulfur-oxidizing protein SoxB
MNKKQHTGSTGLFFKAVISSLCMFAASLPVHAKKPTDDITLIEMGDLHATLVSHQAVLKAADGREYYSDDAGGMAKLKAKVDEIRADNPNSLLLSVGDLTHGSAEGLFTVGDAVMAVMNQFDIDVFTPGNWDFGYGPAVYRARFTPANAPVPANIAVMAGYIDCDTFGDDVIPNCTETDSGIIKAKFPVSAINLYNVSPPLPPAAHNKRVHPKNFELFELDGATVAVIGITAAIVPQQADAFNIGLRFTQGVEELPVAIADAKGAGATIIVVQSELGLSQNLELARRFRDIDVMYSAHTHEVTSGVLLADAEGVLKTTPGGPLSGQEQNRLARGAAIVVETNRDMYVGRLDLKISDSKISGFNWEAIPIDETVVADEEDIVTRLVASVEGLFTGEGVDFTFMPGGFCPMNNCGDVSVRGLRLTEDLDTVVGYTGPETVLLRHHVLEDVLNNFIADAIYNVTNEAFKVDLSMTNGFRFGNAVLPDSDITLRDLYTWFPVGPAVNVADFSGASVEKGLDDILSAVFNRNAFLQRGGWYLGLANMTQTIDLKNRPFGSSSGRIVETRVGDDALDPSKRYVFASCYAHADPIDQVCRTGGGANHRFFQLDDANDYSSDITVVPPVNDEQIIVGTAIKQVAPDRFLHPVHILRRYLDDYLTNRTVEGSDYSVQRVKTVDSTVFGNPDEAESDQIGQPDNTPDPTLVQPPFGAGPKFFSGRVGDGV